MIDKMIAKTLPYLPLKISEAKWKDGVFQMSSLEWNFVALSAWRLSSEDRVVFACYESLHFTQIDASEKIKIIEGLEIISIDCQESLLKIDPVFILSNGQRIEIFSHSSLGLLKLRN